MATEAPQVPRTTNQNNEPRAEASKDVARSSGITYNRGNNSGRQRKDSRQSRG